MLLFRHQNAGVNYDTKIANRFFENVAQVKCFGTTVTDENLIEEKVKRTLNLANACYYHSVQTLSSSRLLSKNIKIRIYKTVILPVLLYGCETWSLTLKEEHRLRVFENKVLRTISEPNRDEVTGGWRKLRNEELHNLYSSPSIIRMIKSRRMKWSSHVARVGKTSEGKTELVRPRCRWEDNIKNGT
jgi:hypothetical protein